MKASMTAGDAREGPLSADEQAIMDKQQAKMIAISEGRIELGQNQGRAFVQVYRGDVFAGGTLTG